MPETMDFSQLPENIKDYISNLQNENNRYLNELESLQTQLNNLTAVIDFADSTKIAEMADLKQKHQQELATLNILMDETIRDRVGEARMKYEVEFTAFKRKYDMLQQEMYELRTKAVDDRDSVLATISRSLRDKLSSNPPTFVQENENLEEDMRKAQESTLMLKSVILPLEAEIHQLQNQLKEAREKIVELEGLPREVNISFLANEHNNELLDTNSLEQSTMSTTDGDLSSSAIVDNSSTSLNNYSIAIVRLNNQCEKLKIQVQELTEQLNESNLAVQHANDERDKYLQIYARTNDRFVAFERKQLEQMRRIMSIITQEQYKVLIEIIAPAAAASAGNPTDSPRSRRAFTSPSLVLPAVNRPIDDLQTNESVPDEKSTNNDDDAQLHAARFHKTETDWDDMLTQISQIMDLSHKFCDKCAGQREENDKLRLVNMRKQEENVKLVFDLSLARAECEKEQELRSQLEQQLTEVNTLAEQDRSKRLQKLRNYALLADEEGDLLLSTLVKKAEKNDIDFRDIKAHYENLFAEQVNNVKKLVKERELLHLYIQRLEAENASLVTITNSDEATRLLTHTTQPPTTLEEAWVLIVKLREEIVRQLKAEHKLRNDIQQLHHNHKADIREREQIEQLLNRDLNAAKDEILVLQSLQTEYERVTNLKNDLEKQIDERVNELKTVKTVANSLTNQLKEKLEQMSQAKSQVDDENAGLRVQMQKLKIDLENSELVQHDFVKLSQSLQVQLEDIRNSENQLRWRPEEDYSECQRCHTSFSVTWRKHHCRHCGKVLCKDCTSKTVYSGPNNRASRVCDVCYTLLVKDSQPYFHSSVPDI